MTVPHFATGAALRRLPLPLALSFALAASLAHGETTPALTLDGRLDEAAWAEARVFDDFVVVEPWTQAAPDPALGTEVRLLSTPAGIALGFRMQQPVKVPLLAPKVARDEMTTADRVNVYLDFDGDGRAAYNFAVLASGSIQDNIITNETQFSPDFDGDWKHAVHLEDGGWSVEILIP